MRKWHKKVVPKLQEWAPESISALIANSKKVYSTLYFQLYLAFSKPNHGMFCIGPLLYVHIFCRHFILNSLMQCCGAWIIYFRLPLRLQLQPYIAT